VIINSVDPRDIEWEVDQPIYRVYFWHHPLALLGWTPQQHMGYHCDEYRVRDAKDVHEVLAWAQTTARPEQTITVYVEHLHQGSPGLIRLAGTDPTAPH
jgi:hypothetical protein